MQKGESVSVMLPNCAEFLPVWFGILKAGAVMSSINTAYKGDFLAHTINLVESKKLIIADEYLDRFGIVAGGLAKLEHVIVMETGKKQGDDPTHTPWEPLSALMEASDANPEVEYSWTDDARIMFTSGTTGLSKGVIKQHAADYFSGRGLLEGLRIMAGKDTVEEMSGETFFSCLPLFHSNAQVLTGYPALIAGARVAYVERFSSSQFWQQVIAAEATIFNSIGAVSYFIYNIEPPSATGPTRSTRSLPHRRRRTSTPSSRSASVCASSRATASPRPAWRPTWTRPSPAIPGSMGKANPGYEVTIVQPGTDVPLPPNTPGEIVVDMRIPNIVMRAYYGMPEKTAEDFRNLKLHTGDLGRMDENGYFYFMDRVKDYIRRRGENVSSMEVERQVAAHPNIKEAAAIGVKAGEGASSEDEIMIVCIPEGDAPDPAEFCHWMAERDAVLHGPALHPLRAGAAEDPDRAGPEGQAPRRGHHCRHLRP